MNKTHFLTWNHSLNHFPNTKKYVCILYVKSFFLSHREIFFSEGKKSRPLQVCVALGIIARSSKSYLSKVRNLCLSHLPAQLNHWDTSCLCKECHNMNFCVKIPWFCTLKLNQIFNCFHFFRFPISTFFNTSSTYVFTFR